MIYTVKWSDKFKKSYKLAKKRGLNISLLEVIVDRLRHGRPLEEKNNDHELKGGRVNAMWTCFWE